MSRDQVEEVKQKTDIVGIVQERVPLKKAGRNFRGLCPFHGEKTPSFYVSPEMQMYKCFGCGVAGDVIGFLEAYEGWDFRETLEYLAKRVGVKLESFRPTAADSARDKHLEIMHLAAEYYHYLLTKHPIGKRGLSYLKKRGIWQESIRDFQLGYALESWDGVQDYLVKKKKYRVVDLEQVGLVIRHSTYYDRFRGRIMFPLKDFAGHIVGFAGRVLSSTEKEAKYINSPETSLYHKQELLFGMSQAKQAIRTSGRVVVVEGELDAIASQQAGVKETVAIKGSAFTEAQALQIRKLTNTVVLALDADSAGQEALVRGIQVAEKQGLTIRVIEVTGGKDPAEIALQDGKQWKAMAENSIPVYQYLIDFSLQKYGVESGPGQKAISQFLAPIFSRIENRVERDFYVKKLAETMGTSGQAIEAEMAKVQTGVSYEQKNGRGEDSKRQSRRERLERLGVALLLQLTDEEKAWREIKPDLWHEGYLQRLVEAIVKARSGKRLTTRDLMTRLPESMRALAEELFGSYDDIWRMQADRLLETFIKVIEDMTQLSARERLAELSRKLSQMDEESGERAQLLQEYRLLSRSLKGMS